MADYEQRAEAVAECLMSYRTDDSGWRVCRKSKVWQTEFSRDASGLMQDPPPLPDGSTCFLCPHWMHGSIQNQVVVSWRPSSEFPGNVYKGDGVVSGSPTKVWECLKPVPNGLRVKWDNNVKKFELLEQISQDVSVCRTVTPSAAMGIIAPRDFVDVILVKKYEDGSISSNATNVSLPGCPPQSGYVRGFNHPCGCICVPISGEPGKTQVLTFFQTDLGGLLPRSVVDSFFPSSMAEFYGNLNNAVKSLRDV